MNVKLIAIIIIAAVLLLAAFFLTKPNDTLFNVLSSIKLDNSTLVYEYWFGPAYFHSVMIYKNGSARYDGYAGEPTTISNEELTKLMEFIDERKFTENEIQPTPTCVDCDQGVKFFVNYNGQTISIEDDGLIRNITQKIRNSFSEKISIRNCEIYGGTWKEFPDDGQYCHDECGDHQNIKCLRNPSFSCDCGPDMCWSGSSCWDNL